MVDNKDKEREEFKKALLKGLTSKPIEPTTYTKEFLEEYRKRLIEPKVVNAQKIGIDALKADNMTDFILTISNIAQETENYINLGCIYAENIELGLECTKNAKQIRADALNVLTEALVEKCGGKMTYIVRD